MDEISKSIQDIIQAMDGCEAATSEEADNILKAGYLPVDEFVRRAKAASLELEEALKGANNNCYVFNTKHNNRRRRRNQTRARFKI